MRCCCGLAASEVRRRPSGAALRRAGNRQVAPARGHRGGTAAEPHASLRYFCSPLHQNSALHPIIARWEQEAGFARGDSAEARLRKLESVVAPANLAPEDVALIAAMLSVHRRALPAARTQPAAAQGADFRRAAPKLVKLHETTRADAVRGCALGRSQLARTSRQTGGPAGGAADPVDRRLSIQFAAPWVGRPGASLIALNAQPRDSEALAVQVTGERALTRALLERIVTQTEAYRCSFEELTKSVLETSAETHGAPLSLAVPSYAASLADGAP